MRRCVERREAVAVGGQGEGVCCGGWLCFVARAAARGVWRAKRRVEGEEAGVGQEGAGGVLKAYEERIFK